MNTLVLELRPVEQRKASIVDTIVSRKDSKSEHWDILVLDTDMCFFVYYTGRAP